MAAVDPQRRNIRPPPEAKVNLVVDEIVEAVEAALAVDHCQQVLLRECGEPRALRWAEESNAVLELKQVREQGGLYGIGLKIDIDPPHLVQRVSNLKDPDGHSINEVRVGDALLLINGQHVELGSIDALEKAILGPKGSTLRLAFARMHPPTDPQQDLKRGSFSSSEDVYEVEVMRHVVIREWDEAHSWLEHGQIRAERTVTAATPNKPQDAKDAILFVSGDDQAAFVEGAVAKTGTLQQPAGPGGLLPMRQSNAVLELKQVREQGGLYGIGLKIDMDPPHLVQRVSNLKDPDGHSINEVRVGDALLLVNGQHVEAVEKAILGPKGSTLNLAFARMHPPTDPQQDLKRGPFSTSEDVYEVEVMRHVAIREWDEAHSWLELRQELRGRPLLADEEIVPVMESVRRCVVDRSNQALDFICEERVAMCSLGIHCAQEMGNGVNEIMDQSLRPNQIQVLVPGSPAHTSGKLKQGRSRFESFFSIHHIPPISLPSPPRYANYRNTRQSPLNAL